MGVPISIRLDDDVRDELEAQARSRGIGLATLLRDLATEAAREARRTRIRQASAAIGAHVATSVEGPSTTIGGRRAPMSAEARPLVLHAGQIGAAAGPPSHPGLRRGSGQGVQPVGQPDVDIQRGGSRADCPDGFLPDRDRVLPQRSPEPVIEAHAVLGSRHRTGRIARFAVRTGNAAGSVPIGV